MINGEFTSSEANDIIMLMIEKKINFHKIQRLQQWEGNHNCNTEQIDLRVKELEEEREVAKKIISESRKFGQNLKINGILQITLVD